MFLLAPTIFITCPVRNAPGLMGRSRWRPIGQVSGVADPNSLTAGYGRWRMDNRVDGPRLLRPGEFDEAIELVRTCFGMGDEEERPTPYWADRADPDRHAVITVDGAVVSHAVGAPVEFTAGPATVPARGIAGVATHPDHRGNGYMTRLMEFWIDRAREDGIPLLELEGDRQRYRRFGWDNAGREFRFAVTPRSHPAAEANPDGVRAYRGTRDDLEFVAAIHDAERYGVRRSLDTYETLLEPDRRQTVLHDDSDGAAYVCYRGDDPVTVEEFGGDPDAIATILGQLCATSGDLAIYTHPHHPFVDRLYEISADWVLRSHRKLRITDLYDVLAAYQPLLETRWEATDRPGTETVTLALTGESAVTLRFGRDDVSVERSDGTAAVTLDRPAMTRLLFGVADGMRSVKRAHPTLATVLPLEYYMWQTETI